MKCDTFRRAVEAFDLDATVATFSPSIVLRSPVRDEPALVFVPDENANRLTQVWGSPTVGQEITAHRGKPSQVSQIVIVAKRLS